jgi:hypothetical protein
MAVTAHWLESTSDQGRQRNLNLRADLVGFLLVPGQHTGDRLADQFLFIIDRLDLGDKVYLLCLVFSGKLTNQFM